MLVDEGDELLIGETEYIVLNKYTQDGKKYLFVANVDNPEENIAENFDSDALELLLISQDEIQDENDESSENNDTSSSGGGFSNDYVVKEEEVQIDTSYEMSNDSNIYNEYSVANDVVKENSQFFTVEKEQSKIEKILEVMFLK